jgi:hypothetical protein
MRRGTLLIWPLTLVAASGTVLYSSLRYGAASVAGTEGLRDLDLAQSRAMELVSLRAAAPSWTRRERPSTGLAPRISAALSAAGLPATAMSSLSPEAESQVGEAALGARRSRAVLTLAPVTLPQLGAFLAAWRSREPHWTVSSLDLAPLGGTAKESPGGDLPLRAVIGLETLFVDRPEQAGGQGRPFVNQSGGAG